ncbi:MAG: MASE3 domain-containing protein [Spirochaetota bacterium]
MSGLPYPRSLEGFSPSTIFKYSAYAVLGAAALTLLYLLSLQHFLVFHFTAELISIAVAFSVFAVTWSARDRLEDGGLLLIGVSYLFVGSVDLFHTLSYEGTGLFPDYTSNLPTQLWLVARGLETAALLLGLRLMGRQVPQRTVVVAFAAATVALVASIIPFRVFPDAYLADTGLTTFKVVTEYVLSAALVAAALWLYHMRSRIDLVMFRWLFVAVIATAAAEILFTFYIDVYAISNAAGHILKIISFYAVFKAIVERGIRRPDKIFYRRLAEREGKLQKALSERDVLMHEMQHRIKNDMSLIRSFLSLEAGRSESEEVTEALTEAGDRVAVLARIYENIYQRRSVETVQVAPLVERTAADLRDSTAFSRPEFELSVADITVPTKVGVTIGLIINELATNALKYAFEHVPKPRIAIRVVPGSSDDTIELTVSDNGPGFPRNVIEGADHSFGLTIASNLAAQYEGTISIENDGGAVAHAVLKTR